MRRLFALALCLFWLALLQSAEIRDDALWLEIYLADGAQLNLNAVDTQLPVFTITEQTSPISRQVQGHLKISFMNWDKLPFWGLLNRIEPLTSAMDDGDYAMRQSFVWQDDALVLKREKLVFEPQSFHSQTSALDYAQQTGVPAQQVHAIPMLNATVKVVAGDKDYYFETPLHIQSQQEIRIGEQRLSFGGEFIIKAMGEKLLITHLISLEDYIAGVIQNEIGSGAPLEALKAQAVTARTHAVSQLLYNRHRGDGYDLCNSVHCQVYKGRYLSNANIVRAVEETAKEVLITEHRIADATYHSSCGGKTDSSANIWKSTPLEHLMGVTCLDEAEKYDLSTEQGVRRWIDVVINDPQASSWERANLGWKRDVSRSRLAQNLGLKSVSKIEILKRGHSGRIILMRITGNKTVTLDSEYRIRQAFGGLPSSLFYIAKSGSTITLKGKGAGHGVGMCQTGTLRLAREDWTYDAILEKYYPGTTLYKDWVNP
ncbi:MAG: SpoIID/LytB domain-containing protein [Candidatus Cloacimonetes bacterium]|nr:SpoIID/LytB domain-containing protein [Candidatus Cloacimonadota bacterium]